MDNDTQIYLSKPGGQRQGPYTLAQIKHSLATNIYRDTDYWAWHEGLPEWLPLYDLPGLSDDINPAPPVPPPSQALTPQLAPTTAFPDRGPDENPHPPEVASG